MMPKRFTCYQAGVDSIALNRVLVFLGSKELNFSSSEFFNSLYRREARLHTGEKFESISKRVLLIDSNLSLSW